VTLADDKAISSAISLLKTAKKPLVIIGKGVYYACVVKIGIATWGGGYCFV
jgi:TPP-dependent trihydroxycyclohexane-1,2-dione (THcHDO) dehydratase